MKNDLEIIRGTSNIIQILVGDAEGAPYTLSEGEKLIFGVKKAHTDKEYALIKAVTDDTVGIYTIFIEPDDTVNLDCDRYLYDVAIQSGDSFYNVIEASCFRVKRNVTKWGCAE